MTGLNPYLPPVKVDEYYAGGFKIPMGAVFYIPRRSTLTASSYPIDMAQIPYPINDKCAIIRHDETVTSHHCDQHNLRVWWKKIHGGTK